MKDIDVGEVGDVIEDGLRLIGLGPDEPDLSKLPPRQDGAPGPGLHAEPVINPDQQLFPTDAPKAPKAPKAPPSPAAQAALNANLPASPAAPAAPPMAPPPAQARPPAPPASSSAPPPPKAEPNVRLEASSPPMFSTNTKVGFVLAAIAAAVYYWMKPRERGKKKERAA